MQIAGSQIKQYQNELAFVIKKAYFDYLKSIEVLGLFEETEKLVNENLRVNQKLLDNNMVTKDAVLRSQTEISKLAMQRNEAEKNQQLAQSYFNFLLNRPFQSSIEIDSMNFGNQFHDKTVFESMDISKREELKQLELGENVYEQLAKINSADKVPSVFLAADYGFQGEENSFTNNDDYAVVTVGLKLKWTLFNGNTNKAAKQQALLQKEQMQIQKNKVQLLIALELQQGLLEIEQKHKNLQVAQTELNHVNEAYRMLNKKYTNGMVTQIELLDAQNNLTQASMQLIMQKFELNVSYAQLEKIVV